MADRILITCTDSMMKQFLEPHVKFLVENGFEIEIACSEVLNRFSEIQTDLSHLVRIHRLDLKRSPFAIKAHIKGYRELRKIISNGHFDLIWTNEPVMGVITRLAAQKARKCGTKVLYMVHGFHFYSGAPIIKWLLFYPIERLMAEKTDILCTINREDYERAQTMGFSNVEYIHGVGINTDRMHSSDIQVDIRKELNLPGDAFLVLSVGELNKNKNQQVIIRAIGRLNDPRIHYLLCGKGDQHEKLERLAARLGVKDQIHFLGYRNDVIDICSQSDVFAMPSRREGMPVALLEAMYCGLPLVNSNARGIADVTENGLSGFIYNPDDSKCFSEGIKKLLNDPSLRMCMKRRNIEVAKQFCIENTTAEILRLLEKNLNR